MSKVGVRPISIPAGTEIVIGDRSVDVKGKEGVVHVEIPSVISVAREGDTLMVKAKNDSKKSRSLHGLTRTLIYNAVLGVSKKWEKALSVVGTGYRVKNQGEDLVFEVGYSHQVVFKKADGVSFSVEGNNKVVVSGVDKQVVGTVAYKIKSIKKPDPYKGKGIRYEGEVVRLKPGKKAKTAA